jgi:hypothetical protein
MDGGDAKLRELLDSILDRSCTDTEVDEFAALVAQNPHLVETLVEQLRINSLLRWQLSEIKHIDMAQHAAAAPRKSAGPSVSFLPFVAWRWRWAAAALVILTLGLGAYEWRISLRGREHGQSVAEIVDAHLVTWSQDSAALHDGKLVAPGRLAITSGTLTLRFRSGATMWVSGAASMEIVSEMLVRLDKGQATAEVPHWATGFTIKTRDVEVVDLGTKFGVVARDSGSTDVVVFEGQVDLKRTSGAAAAQTRLTQGQGVRIGNQGSMDRIVELRRSAEKDQWTTNPSDDNQPDWSESTFKSIRDNIPSVEVPTYYQITPHGLDDDCLAYTDAPHEWNGLTPDGLPEFLRHADYVMTRNDYRYINDFQMTLELAKPAVVYVFFDHRVPPPDWLTEQFENMGVDVGLDEGPWNPGDTKHATGVGGGVSIDNVFSVWRRRCEKPETIKLGAMGKKPGARAMYGIAAQPLD